MGRNPGPGGNAQNNPGGPQANYGMGMKPGMGAWANMMQTYPGLGSGGVSQMPSQLGGSVDQINRNLLAQAGGPGNPWANSTANSVGQSMGGPMANFQSMMGQQIPWGSTPRKSFTFGGWNRPEMGGGTPIGIMTPPTPQPQEPIGGYINGQPAQWHYQAEALKNPPPRNNSAGLPSGGILAKLYGG